MQPLATLLQIYRQDPQPIYLQIAAQLIDLIRKGILRPDYRLPSTRALASGLTIHRKTVIQAYDELIAQGWLQTQIGSGTFVSQHLPELSPRPLVRADVFNPAKQAGFSFQPTPHLDRSPLKAQARYHLDDGFPDARLAPVQELSRAYRSQLLAFNPYTRLGYNDPSGSRWLREELAIYLNATRGLRAEPENILIVRGTMMGVYLASTALLQPGDEVAVEEYTWSGARMNFLQAGARVTPVPIDAYGIDVDALEQICQQRPLRMLYLTSHHQYPTTVPLRADRRMRLLTLAQTYKFIVFEDDYDYDFHYESKPLFPLASADLGGLVLYSGSFTKTISPAFRVGYLVGPENVIQHLAKLRRIIDRQGDTLLENAMAELLHLGVIQRHIRKSLRMYRHRRDLFCDYLQTELGHVVDFRKPEGGMSVWTAFDSGINLVRLAEKALQKNLYLSNGTAHESVFRKENVARLGFASSTEEELVCCVKILKSLL